MAHHGRRVRTAHPLPDAPKTASFKGAEMRAMFVTYLVLIWLGLGYFIALGALHT